MKKFQSVLCALVLALSFSSTVLGGDIHAGISASAAGNIDADKTVNASGILISELFTWSDIPGGIVSGFGILIGC